MKKTLTAVLSRGVDRGDLGRDRDGRPRPSGELRGGAGGDQDGAGVVPDGDGGRALLPV